jgi:hypothetical protein
LEVVVGYGFFKLNPINLNIICYIREIRIGGHQNLLVSNYKCFLYHGKTVWITRPIIGNPHKEDGDYAEGFPASSDMLKLQ